MQGAPCLKTTVFPSQVLYFSQLLRRLTTPFAIGAGQSEVGSGSTAQNDRSWRKAVKGHPLASMVA
jgi:hypothetical protein